MAQDDRNIMEHQQRLGIMPKQSMQSGQGTNANQEPLISEILTKVNKYISESKNILKIVNQMRKLIHIIYIGILLLSSCTLQNNIASKSSPIIMNILALLEIFLEEMVVNFFNRK